jgi:hypothetical protein
MPYFGYALLNTSICVAIKHNSSQLQQKLKDIKVYCQNMA